MIKSGAGKMNANDSDTAAARTVIRKYAKTFQDALGHSAIIGGLQFRSKVTTACFQFGGFVTVAEQAVVPDTTESSRQDVLHKSMQQGLRLQLQYLLLAAMGVVTPAQTYGAVGHAQQTIVGQGDTVGVTGQIFQHFPWAAKRLLGVYDP